MQLSRFVPGDSDLDHRLPPHLAASRRHELQQPERDPPGLLLVKNKGRTLGHQTDHALTMA